MIVAPLIASLTPEALAALPEHRVAMLRYAWDLFARESQKPPPGDWTDITYIPMARGFLYLVAIMDWHSRYVLAWRLSNTLEVDFCVAALEEALSKGRPQIFNTDQGSQFTSEAFTSMLLAQGVQVSMDGRGRCMDNVFVERLWRSIKYEEVYLKAYRNGTEARKGIGAYLAFYNQERPHQALGYRSPGQVFHVVSPQRCLLELPPSLTIG